MTRRVLIVAGVLAVTLMWIYFIFFAQPANTDKLNQDAFPKAAEPICKATLDKLAQIGVVNQKADTPQQRAELVDRADDELRTMVDQLKTIDVPNPDDEHAISAWLGDWDQWLRDRTAWSAQLHGGQNVQFFETQRESTKQPNSKALNDFAEENLMRSCATPGGV